MSIAQHVQYNMKNTSWIRRMFEKGQELRERYGKHNVFDFSLGTPLLEPPEAFQSTLRYLVNHPHSGMHRYMPNNGFASTRQAVAMYLSQQETMEVSADDIIMTVGAAGAMNVALAALLDPGDETIVLAPYFAEYLFYPRNHGGMVSIVETTESFALNLDAIEAAIHEKTKVIIINTPNNPTGRVYSQQEMNDLGALLDHKEKQLGRALYLMADTPYARLIYDQVQNPRLFVAHHNTLIVHSFSKDIGLAGERIGYLAINPRATCRSDLRAAATFLNRTLGFVNAPALMQLALERSIDATVDIDHYRLLRDTICDGLRQAGYEISVPQGAFFLFLRSPIPDDVDFSKELLEENVLAVPGSGFGRAGYIRLSYSVPLQTIEGALPRFAKVLDRVKNR
jgi:aspartate aminotransferase